MRWLLAWWVVVAPLAGAELLALPEFARPDPFGEVVGPDRPADLSPKVALAGARAGYASFHLAVKLPEGGEYSLAVRMRDSRIQADLYREWFHRIRRDGSYYPDALIPVAGTYRSKLPEPDNRIPKQTSQSFWVDLWIPPDATPGVKAGEAVLEAGGRSIALPIELKVLAGIVPDADSVVIDHNSYGLSWLEQLYPQTAPGATFPLIHSHHRIFYEHRGVFHQLGYGHGGKVGPEFAPALEGSGRTRRVASWELYDRHYGPLLDGSAFAQTRRGARPIPFVYLPINPEWPASFLRWGEPGYETEFVNVVGEMERHFREKGWTQTNFEVFFNHKKRYKAFPWDGDETRFAEDDAYFPEYGRLLKKAVPVSSPVKFVFRSDSSWSMERQFRVLAGVVNFWVVSGGMLSWYKGAPETLQQRGDIVWMYGGTPPVTEVSTAITRDLIRTWVYGAQGFVRWLTVSPGPDPWFQFDGGGTALVYPGERFGIGAPIPSVRLKLQRNCLQDLALLSQRPALKDEVATRYNGLKAEEWWTPRPPLADTPPHEWTNATIGEAERPTERRLFGKLNSKSWQAVRELALRVAEEP